MFNVSNSISLTVSHYVSVQSFQHGLGIFVNGHLLGSTIAPGHVVANTGAIASTTLCIGHCGSNTGHTPNTNIALSNIVAAGASALSLANNNLLGILGKHLAVNLVYTSRPFYKKCPEDSKLRKHN